MNAPNNGQYQVWSLKDEFTHNIDNFPNLSFNLSFSLFEEKCYVYNVFKTLSQQIISGSLLQFVIGGQKNNFNNRYKLKQKTICWKVFEKSYLKD